MGEHDNHRQRVYMRALEGGLASFPEHNALELLLFYCQPRCDTNELAHRLINTFGSFAAVLDAPLIELARVKGVGQTTAQKLKLIPPLCNYYLTSRVQDTKVLDSAEKAVEYLQPRFFGKTEEELYMISLDDKRRILQCALVSHGNVNTTAVNVSQIVSIAMQQHATGVILSHNHPRGIVSPSPDDVRSTMEICKALSLLHIEVLDHIIFTENEHISMAQNGVLQNIKETLRVRPFGAV